MRGKRTSVFLLLALFSFCCLSECAQSHVWKEPYTSYELIPGTHGGRLALALTSDPKSFNPVVAKETSTTTITSYFFEGLTKTDPLNLEVKPNLAESWHTDDGITWIFNLRKDVYFSDGEQFTAADVIFTFNDLIYNPTVPTSSRDTFTIEGKKILVEAIDRFTVKFTLPSVFAPFLRALGTDILPKHTYAALVREGAFTFSMGLDSKTSDIVGTGPFRLKTYLAGERVVLERNPYYWKKDTKGNKLPYLDEIVFIIIPNAETVLLKFLEKEIDYYSLRPEDLAILGPKAEKEQFSIYNVGVNFGSNFLVLNQNPSVNVKTKKPFVKGYKLKWFRNENFRKALSFALDRKKMITVVFNELGVEQYSPLSPSNILFYSDDVITYPYNPQKAKSLLSEEGFVDRDGDGFLEDEDANKVEIEFFTNANNPLRIKMASLIKKDLERIGVKIHFFPLDFNNLVVKLTNTYDWEMMLIGLTGGIEPHFGKNVWSYTGTLHAWNPTGAPLDEYEETIEEIYNEAARTLDEKKRFDLYSRWQYIASDELPFIYTVLPFSIFAVSDKFGNAYPTIHAGVFPEIEKVYIKEGYR